MVMAPLSKASDLLPDENEPLIARAGGAGEGKRLGRAAREGV
jgi:hypothetical protein